MSSFDKVVKLACKPKAAPPKAKYLDPIIAATWSEDGAVHDVCKALVPRFREPNAIVVFKALIVLHTMIRNGSTDNVLSYLSSTEVLRLHNVSAGNWEGYNAPQNLQHYASYLDSRIRAYRDLNHDVIHVQSETNRDMRMYNSIEEDMPSSTRSKSGSKSSKSTRTAPQRSKTMMGRKLRVMTVEKGLLRETRTVQKMIDTLVECRFYLDDLEDELTITALRMLVKDLLILFQAGNEGVINVLEHYFEMSHVDAEEALVLYRHFCGQTERVVEYLGVAKKLQNLLNVPIPNLKHAPVSLAGALDEYLKDPNFEQNRIEYKANKDAADKNAKMPFKPASKPEDLSSQSKTTATSSTQSTSAPNDSNSSSSKPDPNQAMIDFFSAIEEEQPTIFNPQSGSPTSTYFQQQAAHNPFTQRQMSGAFGPQPTGFQSQMLVQPTGFPMSSQPFSAPTQPFQAPPPNPFGLQLQQQGPFGGLQSQPTGFPQAPAAGFLQPQATGAANPFRQSMLFQQATGMPAFNAGTPAVPSRPFQAPEQQQSNLPFAQTNTQQQPQPLSAPSAGINFSATNALTQGAGSTPFSQLPNRSASTPLTSFGSSSNPVASPPQAQPVRSHQTGSRNPFGTPAPPPAPPVPKLPTLMELAMGANNPGVNPPMHRSQQAQQQQQGPFSPSVNGFAGKGAGPPGSIMTSVASSFISGGKPEEQKTGFTAFENDKSATFPPSTQNTSTTTSSSFSSPMFSSISSQPTGTTAFSSAISSFSPGSPLKPQMTGFSGIKPFKPSSAFGASLLESLPPIPEPTSTPDANSTTTNPIGQQSTNFGTFNAQPTGIGAFSQPGVQTVGVGLRPQATGLAGAANPFRASMFAGAPGPATNGNVPMQFTRSVSTPQSIGGPNTGLNGGAPFGTTFSGVGAFAPNLNASGQDASKQQQQNGTASLI